MKTQPNTSRRKFLAGAAGAIAAPTIIPATVLGKNAPSNRVNMGFVGMGNRGTGVMTALLNHEKAQGIAVCDLDKHHKRGKDYGLDQGVKLMNQAMAKKGGSDKDAAGYKDYREMIGRGDLDAVMVATPDHWHGLVCMEAARADCDIYCEKPITHYFAEGYHLHREVAKRGLIFQVGSQQRSEKLFRHAVEVVRNGHLGKVKKVEVGLPRGKTSVQGDATITEPPATLDYDMWCGPSEKLPYMEARCHWNWRWHLSYGGGQLMDWIGHHNDICHWGLDMDKGGPLSVEAKNFTYQPGLDIYNSPVDYDVHCEYPGGVQVLISSRNQMGTKWIGENGWIWVTRGKIDASTKAWVAPEFETGEWKGYRTPGHQRNFMEGVLNRKECICPAETGHRSATPGHLGYVSHALGRPIKWDAKAEKIVGDDEAQKRLIDLPYRGDWKLI